jgi:cytochrome P450
MRQLGVPEQDEAELLRMTQVLFGAHDLDFGDSNLTPEQRLVQVVTELNTYFGAMAQDRRRNPRNDIATILANATIDGAPLDPMNLLSYFIIVATAGHDTTSATIAGGLKALMENPEQLQRLRNEPALMPKAVAEMLRWVAPVKHFVRTAVQDVEIGGQPIQTNDAVMLLFASACRDEAVFPDGDRFRIDREPNLHLAFGYGPHVCLGMHLARLEIAAFFQALLPRLRHIEPGGKAEYTESIFVSGLKRLPVRVELA